MNPRATQNRVTELVDVAGTLVAMLVYEQQVGTITQDEIPEELRMRFAAFQETALAALTLDAYGEAIPLPVQEALVSTSVRLGITLNRLVDEKNHFAVWHVSLEMHSLIGQLLEAAYAVECAMQGVYGAQAA